MIQKTASGKTKPLVSFIITYHDEDTAMLTQCVESVLALSLSGAEREIIIVDDGSCYCPMNELLKYGGDIIYLRKPNGGLSSARNMGLSLANGEFVQFVDADDYLLSVVYEHCVDIIRYSEVDMVMFDYTSNAKKQGRAVCETAGPTTGAEYMVRNNLHASAWGYVFKRSLLHEHRFTENLIHEDEEFTPLLVLRSEHLYKVNAAAYFYRKRDNSITHRNDLKWSLHRLDNVESIITKLFYMKDSLPIPERRALQRRVDQLTMDYLYNTIVMTRSMRVLNERIARLEKLGQFPLPDKNYTKKYVGFRKMINSSVGRRLLMMSLPIISKRK